MRALRGAQAVSCSCSLLACLLKQIPAEKTAAISKRLVKEVRFGPDSILITGLTYLLRMARTGLNKKKGKKKKKK